MGLVGPVLGQAVASPLSPKRLTHATVYSARVPIVEGRTIEEAERIARDTGSVVGSHRSGTVFLSDIAWHLEVPAEPRTRSIGRR